MGLNNTFPVCLTLVVSFISTMTFILNKCLIICFQLILSTISSLMKSVSLAEVISLSTTRLDTDTNTTAGTRVPLMIRLM